MTTGLEDLSREVTELQQRAYRQGWRDAMSAMNEAITEIRNTQPEFFERPKQDAET